MVYKQDISLGQIEVFTILNGYENIDRSICFGLSHKEDDTGCCLKPAILIRILQLPATIFSVGNSDVVVICMFSIKSWQHFLWTSGI